MAKDRVFELCDIVRTTSLAAHKWFGPGYLEKGYENSLFNRLSKQGLQVEQKVPLSVHDEDGTIVRIYEADLIVENCLLLEIKETSSLHDRHVAQLLGYLRTTRIEHGLLINFGEPKLQIKKYYLSKDRWITNDD